MADNSETPPEENALPEREKNRIPAYKVAERTERFPEEQRKAIRALHAYYYDTGKSVAEIGALIGYDGGNVSKIFSGTYTGNLDAVVHAISRFLRLSEERSSVNKAPYIKTALYHEIEEVCQAALVYQKLAFIYGESQVGKTEALLQYTSEHKHETTYVEMPVGGAMTHFTVALADRLRLSSTQRDGILQLNIMRSLGPSNLLIVDETSRALQARTYRGATLRTMDFIRALHDNTGCGIVLCGTNVFRDQMADKALAKFLNQFNRRTIIRRQLPDVPSRADLNAFARHYSLEAASGDAYELQKMIVRQHGLGVWLTTLRAAANKASKEKRPLTWEHVIKARKFFTDAEKITTEDGL